MISAAIHHQANIGGGIGLDRDLNERIGIGQGRRLRRGDDDDLTGATGQPPDSAIDTGANPRQRSAKMKRSV
jgi:hypothetical protein